MLNKGIKLTALLVAAASAVSSMPAMAAVRLANKDGHIEQGIAYKDGKYLYKGYRNDDDTDGIYYNNGERDKLVDDADEIEEKFDKDKVAATDSSTNYVINLETGKSSEDDGIEDLEDNAITKLRGKLDDTKRYDKESIDFKTISQDANSENRLNRVSDNRFEDTWFSYQVTSGAQSDAGVPMDKFGYISDSGVYIDCSYDLNLYAYSTVTSDAAAKGKMYPIKDIEDTADGVKEKGVDDDDKEISVKGIQFVKYIGQDDKYIYSVIAVYLENSYSVYTGEKIATTTPHYYVQKVTKQRDDKQDGAYKPKDTECYEIAPEKAKDGDSKTAIAMGNGDISDAFNALLADTHEAKNKTYKTTDITTDLDGKNVKYAIVDGIIYAYFEDEEDKIKTYKIKLASSEKLDRYNNDLKKDKDRSKLSSHVAIKDGDKDHKMKDVEDDNCPWTIDINGTLWFIDNGTIYKSVKMGDYESVYSCDRSLDCLDVYDENNLIAWDSDDGVYTTVTEGAKAAKEEAEQLVGNQQDQNNAQQQTAKVGWDQLADGSWNFYDATGAKVLGWVNVGGTWYFMDKTTGVMQTGWVQDGGNWYYLNPVSDGWKGAMKTGWINDRGTWYYLNSSGAMLANQWFQDTDGNWYYLNQSGAMAVNTTIGGYYVGANGAWIR